MIRINLLTVERPRARKRKRAILPAGQQLTIGCSTILVAALAVVGWRYWSLGHQSSLLDGRITAAQREAAQLHSVIVQVQQFEQRRAQLQQRVGLIEQLRQEQTGPVHMLDQISRALPPKLWLTELTQSDNPNEVAISGKCTNLTGLSDFVRNLEASGYFKRSVEIVKSEAASNALSPGELITFTIRAVFQRPGEASSGAAPAAQKHASTAPTR